MSEAMNLKVGDENGFKADIGGLVGTITNSDGSTQNVVAFASKVVTSFVTTTTTDEDTGSTFSATGTIFGISYSDNHFISLSVWPRSGPSASTSTPPPTSNAEAITTTTTTTTITVTETPKAGETGAGGLVSTCTPATNAPLIAATSVFATLFVIAVAGAWVFWRRARTLKGEKEAMGGMGAVPFVMARHDEQYEAGVYKHELPALSSRGPVELQSG